MLIFTENYSVERSGAGDVGQMSNFWTHSYRQAAAVASLRFDRSVSFHLVQLVQQQENIYPTDLQRRQIDQKLKKLDI
jgi:hypothetical protein